MSDAGKAEKPKKDAGKRREVNAGTQVAVGEHAREAGYVPRFKKRYNETIKADLMKKLGYTKAFKVRKLKKLVLNTMSIPHTDSVLS